MSDQRPDDPTQRPATPGDTWLPPTTDAGGATPGTPEDMATPDPATPEGAAPEGAAPKGAAPGPDAPTEWIPTEPATPGSDAAPAPQPEAVRPPSSVPAPPTPPPAPGAAPQWAASPTTGGPGAQGPTPGWGAPRPDPAAGPGWGGAPMGVPGRPEPGRPAPGGQNPWAAPAPTLTRAAPTRAPHTHRRTPGWLALVIAMVITALVSVGGTYALIGSPTSTATPSPSTSTTQATSQTVAPVTSSGTSADWQAVAKAVSPAVVTITVDTQSSESIGSGVIFDASGHVVTNYHVIADAASASSGATITVTLADQRIYTGTVVGHDETTDLAVVQIKDPPSDLTVATFGSSSALTVGQQVMAIGSPLGLSDTVTTGIISALNRPVEVATSNSQGQTDPNDPFGQLPGQQSQGTTSSSVITNAIQVDASINPGNSGGPLFDETGAVVGINSSIASMSSTSDTAGSIGLGFAIPSNLVTSVVHQLISTGTVDHAVLGVTIQSGTATIDGTTEAGAEVVSVSSGSGADKAGLRQGDVIVSIDGNPVSSAKALTGFVRTYKGGDTATVEYVRGGKKQSVVVTLQSTAS